MAAATPKGPKKPKKPKVEYRKRLSSSVTDVRYLEGPFYVSGELGQKLPSVHRKVWFDPDSEQFVFADGRLAFDAMPSDTVTVSKSDREIKREAKEEALASAQADLNAIKRKEEQPLTRKELVKLRKDKEKVTNDIAAIRKDLVPLRTSTQKVSEARDAVQSRPFPTSMLTRGELPIVAEYDKKSDRVNLFFDGGKFDVEEGKYTGRDTKGTNTIAPAVRDILLQHVDKSSKDKGERGFWSVPSWEYPDVIEQLSKIPQARILGAPELDLDKKFKSLDAKARAIKTDDIVWGEKPPKVGAYPDGKIAKFQEEGVKFLMSRERGILADDMGLGKTYQAIIAAHNAVPKSQQILVLCPAAVIGNWLKDIEAFMPSAPAIGFDTHYVDSNGDASLRPEKVRFFVCSYQGAVSQEGRAQVSKTLAKRKWGLVILDEAHRIKKTQTLLHKWIEGLNTDRMWFLTGTPIANTVVDFYGLLKMAHTPMGDSYEKFVRNYVPKYAKSKSVSAAVEREKLIRLGNDVTGFVLRRTKEEVLSRDLPKKYGGFTGGEGFIDVNLPTEFKDALAAASKAEVPFERLRHTLAVGKVPATWEVAERVIDAGDKIVLFSTYTDVLHAFAELCDQKHVLYVVISGQVSTLGKSTVVKLFQGEPLSTKKDANELKWAKKNLGQWFLNLLYYVPTSDTAAWPQKELDECIKRFGRDESKWPHKIQVVLAQMVAASEGVTLTQADTMLFNDFDHMPSRHSQAEDRIYRLSRGGPPYPVVYIGYLFANDPTGIDKGVLKGLRTKQAEIDDVYDAIGLDGDEAARKVREDAKRGLARVRELRSARYGGGKRKNPDTTGL